MSYLLEVCADSVRSAVEAQAGGADRIELCSGLVIGCLSPSVAMFEQVKKNVDIPVRVLLRPRFGDFCYDGYEFETLKEEVCQSARKTVRTVLRAFCTLILFTDEK